MQADNEEAMKDWVKDIEETAVMVVPVLGADAATSGAAPVAARQEETATISVKLRIIHVNRSVDS